MIASAVISALGTAASGVMSFINNRNAKREADAEYAREQAYNEARAAENPLARSENQAVINEYDRAAKAQVETARNRNKIMGGTPEMDLATQQAVANGRASLMSGIASQASTRADKYNDKAEEARQAKYTADAERRAQRNQTYAALAANAANAMGGLFADGESDGTETAPVRSVSEQVEQGKQVNAEASKSMASTIASAKSKLATGAAAAGSSKPSVGSLVTANAPTAASLNNPDDLKIGYANKAASNYLRELQRNDAIANQQRAQAELNKELARDWRYNL